MSHFRDKRLFALEEGFVTIFPEYSPFFNAPILGSSRKINNAGQWVLRYDISGMPDLKNPIMHNTASGDLVSKEVSAIWQDVYMSNLKWSKKPNNISFKPSGMPFEYSENIGHTGTLSFDAAHFGDALWKMTGFRRHWRIFVDLKEGHNSQVERSWEFRGCLVDSNDYSGSPLSLSRNLVVREIPEGDATFALDPAFRTKNVYVRGTPKLEYFEVVSIEPDLVSIVTGSYTLEIMQWSTAYDPTATHLALWNGKSHYFKWENGKQVVFKGGKAGAIKLLMNSPIAPAATPLNSDKEEIMVIK